jgi:hypothetical protein
MTTVRIVPAFDEVGDGQNCVGLGLESVGIEQLRFAGREEALGERIVVGIID